MKMYFYYGVMGSSKTATALMKKFNFEEHGRKVILLKPYIDVRSGKTIVKSRIGLACEAIVIDKDASIIDSLRQDKIYDFDTIIVDEAQFFNKHQIDELRQLTNEGIMVMCYGLKTDYMCNLFEGSKRLLEVADSIRELQSPCQCGRKAIINARYKDGEIIYKGEQIEIGGNDKYKPMCYQCWVKGKNKA